MFAGFLRKRMMGFFIKSFAFQWVNSFAGQKHDIQQFINPDINFLLRNASFLNRFHQLARGIAASGRHFQMRACTNAFRKIIVRAPVGNNKPVESPGVP